MPTIRFDINAPQTTKTAYFAHETATIDPGSVIGSGTKIWHYSHIMPTSRLGKDCRIGQNVYIAEGVTIGDRVSIQNNVSVYRGVSIDDDVFVGPNVCFTNVRYPRAFISRKEEYESTRLGRGCSLGANTTIRCGVSIGSFAMVGAGSLLVKSVADYALVTGHPATQIGWVSRRGCPLKPCLLPVAAIDTSTATVVRTPGKSGQSGAPLYLSCPESGDRFVEQEGHLYSVQDGGIPR